MTRNKLKQQAAKVREEIKQDLVILKNGASFGHYWEYWDFLKLFCFVANVFALIGFAVVVIFILRLVF